TATNPLIDGATGIGGPGLLRLDRQVEMYQWHEHKSDEQIEYRKEWSSSPQNSDSFRNRQGHENPRMPLRDAALVNEGVALGAFVVDQRVTAE
ncbi:TMEM43 family protein, partial [Escherichia coli]